MTRAMAVLFTIIRASKVLVATVSKQETLLGDPRQPTVINQYRTTLTGALRSARLKSSSQALQSVPPLQKRLQVNCPLLCSSFSRELQDRIF